MTQPLKDDRYGRPITHYELPLLEPAPVLPREEIEHLREWEPKPEVGGNKKPREACPVCNGGHFWRSPQSETLWLCIDCTPVNKGPVLMFIGKVGR